MLPDDFAAEWLERHDVPRETSDRLSVFLDALIVENEAQNLIARSTVETIWTRHVIDSAQLLDHAPQQGSWVDLGSGAGFPGLIVAALARRPVTLIESRAKRVQFLQHSAELLGIEHLVTIESRDVLRIAPQAYDVVSARAFAPLDRLLTMAAHLADAHTLWLLPKGRGAAAEVDSIGGTWQGRFATVPSITSADGAIIVATDVMPKAAR